MKKIISSLLLLLVISAKCFSQSEWYGTWSVNCSVAKEDLDKPHPDVCPICPRHVDTKKKWTVDTFVFTIKQDSIAVKMPRYAETASYIWVGDKSNITFTFQGKPYTFHAYVDAGQHIFKDDKGYSLMLKKK